MNEIEMIEKLVEKENVSFEEAHAALKACSGDIVDAVVYLERKAKEDAAQAAEAEVKALETMNAFETDGSSQEDNHTNNDGSVKEEKGEEKMMKGEAMNTKSNTGAKIRGFFKRVKEVLVNNELRITRNEEEKVRIPAWVVAILIACFFHIGTVILIVSLFLGCRYSFVGKDNLSRANDVMEKASDVADKVKAQFN